MLVVPLLHPVHLLCAKLVVQEWKVRQGTGASKPLGTAICICILHMCLPRFSLGTWPNRSRSWSWWPPHCPDDRLPSHGSTVKFPWCAPRPPWGHQFRTADLGPAGRGSRQVSSFRAESLEARDIHGAHGSQQSGSAQDKHLLGCQSPDGGLRQLTPPDLAPGWLRQAPLPEAKPAQWGPVPGL